MTQLCKVHLHFLKFPPVSDDKNIQVLVLFLLVYATDIKLVQCNDGPEAPDSKSAVFQGWNFKFVSSSSFINNM